MTRYILAIVGVVLVSAIITIIAPGGKMGRFLKGATKLATLVVMLSPLANLTSGEGLTFSVTQLQTDEGYLAHCAGELAQKDADAIAIWIDETYGVTASAQVERSTDATFSYQKIAVVIIDFGIYEQEERIYISEQIQSVLQSRYGCETEVACA